MKVAELAEVTVSHGDAETPEFSFNAEIAEIAEARR
jgi:hypothetical protein